MPIIRVPLELKPIFLKDPENFIRDIACISTEAIRPYFRRREKLIELDKKAKNRRNPFDGNTRQFDDDFLLGDGDTFRRFMHIDLGITKDAVGISMCHAPYFVEGQLVSTKRDQVVVENVRVPYIKFDFLGRIKVSKGEEILLMDIREIIYDLTRRGFYLALITYDGFQCLGGNTKVALLDGRDILIKELINEFGRKKEFWVYAFDGEKIVPAKAKNVRKTGRRIRTLEIHLDNGEIIQCTPNHPFMLRNGKYVLAESLKPGQALMPFLTKQLKTSRTNKTRKYKRIYQPKKRSWEYIHRMVKGETPLGHQVHHIDRNPFNNTPENLQTLTAKEHLEVHRDSPSFAFLSYWAAVQLDPELKRLIKEKKSESLRTRWRSSERKKLLEMNKRAVEASRSSEAREKRSRSMMNNTNGRFNKGNRHCSSTKRLISSLIRKKWEDPDYRAKMEKVDRLSGIRGKKWKFDEEQGKRVYYNHKVVKIEEGPIQDVYDIEVPIHHNFALSAGVFVHNSVDSRQILQSQGYRTSRLSIDRTSTRILFDKHAKDGTGLRRESTDGQILSAYQALKDALYWDRLDIPWHEFWLKEAKGAQIDYKKNKVDHPPRGSIDVLQSMAGAAYNLTNNEFEQFEESQEVVRAQEDRFYEEALPSIDDQEGYLYPETQEDNTLWDHGSRINLNHSDL